MLDNETKRRIDNARDILVGKLPNPQSQVEQITIALIYKFMDDMDAQSVEYGGEASFFTGDYAKYAWSKLFAPALGGHERLALYGEAIVELNRNPNLPQLFRDIFKNAFLPYRDPETLTLFLKTINEFKYDHSERLGDAFEYLLSVLGSQGDAGQFRTPRHIIDFIVDILDPKKNETICDPACGTAGFLISSYKHILENNQRALPGDLLSPAERSRMMKNFVGYDISPDMVRLSLVNLYLHGFPDPSVIEYDTLTSEDRWNETYDIILANPPFMSPKGGIKPHKKFSISANRSEVLFVDYIAEHIHPAHGRAGIIVPEGIIFQSATAYKSLRKMLVEDDYLYAVVSLPAGVFNPYSGVKTSILLMDRTLAQKTDKILFVKITNDGFGLGAQRREQTNSDLPDALNLIRDFQKAVFSGDTSGFDIEDENIQAVAVEKSRISENGEYGLSGERYKVVQAQNRNYELVSLGDVCEINSRSADPLELFGDNDFVYVDITSVENGTGRISFNNILTAREAPSRARRLIKKNDILLSTVRPNLKAFGFVNDHPERTIASTGFAVITPKEKVEPRFVHLLMFEDFVLNQMTSTMEKGAYPSINQKDVAELRIPLPPLSIQKEIVEKIEGYQRIIDGAKQVIENYKPQIEISPGWPIAKLSQVCDVIMGQSPDGESYNTTGEGIPLINGPVEFGGSDPQAKTVKTKFTTKPTKLCRENDLILCVRGATTGRTNIAGFDACIGRGVAAIRARENQQWINNCVIANRDKILSLGAGSTFPNVTSKQLFDFEIPFPPLDVQKEIVARINQEQELVNANKELIKIFEQKIKTEIAKLWEE